jgi:ubiquinone/menaquinone biosynthesis C-methylase UbiE
MDWGLGRYELIAEQLLPASEVVVDQAAPAAGERFVDVGCGTGNAALLAAERGATVTGVDPVKRLLDVAAAQAAERRLHATFLVGEAESIPVPDAGADAVISVFGAIFAPDPKEAAAEMARILDPEGRMLLAAWVPGGPISDAIRFTRETLAEIRGDPPPTPPFAWQDS